MFLNERQTKLKYTFVVEPKKKNGHENDRIRLLINYLNNPRTIRRLIIYILNL